MTTLTIGDIVTGYRSGYFVISEIEFETDMVSAVQIARKDGVRIKNNRKYKWATSYCTKVTNTSVLEELKNDFERVELKRRNLEQLFREFNIE